MIGGSLKRADPLIRRLRGAAFAASWLLSGCSLLINLDHDQCERSSDCTKLGLMGSCVQGVCSARVCDGGACSGTLGQSALAACGTTHPCDSASAVCFKEQCAPKADVQPFICAPAPARPSNVPIALTLHAQEMASQMPPRGLMVSACRASDLACETPVATWIDARGQGDVVLQLPYGFEGYLQADSEETLPGLYFFTQPLLGATQLGNLLLVAPKTLSSLTSFTGLASHPDTGLVALEAYDCAGKAAGGIHFEESKPTAVPFFLIDGLPNTDSSLTVRDDSRDTAAGGCLNASPGFTIFSARIGVNGPLLGQFNANVRANTVTYLDFHP
jgi:hypothetical protein